MPNKRRKICNVDRFSTLPDEVAHRILEFVSIREISRLCVVSRRCRQLCLSTPFFDVDDLSVRGNPAKLAQLMNFVDRVLSQRGFIAPVFRLDWSELRDEQQGYRFLSWLHRAVSSNVRELRLVVANLRDGGAGFTLPSSLLSCSSLEILHLRAALNILPTDLGRFSSLKSLVLARVRIDQSIFKWISQCCKRLFSLSLDDTHGTDNITVASSSLRFLDIRFPYTIVHLQVNAENLETLFLVLLTKDSSKANQFVAPNVRNVLHIMAKSLEDDSIDLVEHRKMQETLCCGPITSLVMRQLSSQLLHMRVFGDTLVEMYVTGSLPVEMPNLESLSLDMNKDPSYNVDLVSVMAAFLKGTPNCDCLVISFNVIQGNEKTVSRGLPEVASLGPSTHKLKYLQVSFPYGVQKSKLELIDYFMDSAEVIYVVSPMTPQPCDVDSHLKGYDKKKVIVRHRPSVPCVYRIAPFQSNRDV